MANMKLQSLVQLMPQRDGYLEWNTLPSNNCCWESSFWGSKMNFLTWVLLLFFCCGVSGLLFFRVHQLPSCKDPCPRSHVKCPVSQCVGTLRNLILDFPLDLSIPDVSQRICGDQADSPLMKNAVHIYFLSCLLIICCECDFTSVCIYASPTWHRWNI